MEDAINTIEDVTTCPEFISDALNQLLSLKTNFTKIRSLQEELTSNTDINDLATKTKFIIDLFNDSVTNIQSTFNEKFLSFKICNDTETESQLDSFDNSFNTNVPIDSNSRISNKKETLKESSEQISNDEDNHSTNKKTKSKKKNRNDKENDVVSEDRKSDSENIEDSESKLSKRKTNTESDSENENQFGKDSESSKKNKSSKQETNKENSKPGNNSENRSMFQDYNEDLNSNQNKISKEKTNKESSKFGSDSENRNMSTEDLNSSQNEISKKKTNKKNSKSESDWVNRNDFVENSESRKEKLSKKKTNADDNKSESDSENGNDFEKNSESRNKKLSKKKTSTEDNKSESDSENGNNFEENLESRKKKLSKKKTKTKDNKSESDSENEENVVLPQKHEKRDNILADKDENDIEINDNIRRMSKMSDNLSESDTEAKKENIDINEIEEKPKVGLIKCIDITKLLDPGKVITTDQTVILLSSDSETPTPPKKTKKSPEKRSKNRVKNPLNKNNINKMRSNINNISSEDEESMPLKNRTRAERNAIKNKSKFTQLRQAREQRNKKVDDTSSDNSSSSAENNVNNKSKSDANSSSSEGEVLSKIKYRTRTQENAIKNKTKFAQLKKAREERNKKFDVSSSDDSSSSDESTVITTKNEESKKKRYEKKKIVQDPNYDYKQDPKFKNPCSVMLLKLPIENLKQYYFDHKEELEIKRLTNMNSLKRSRKDKMSSESSMDDKKEKKRSRVQTKKTHNSEHSNNDSDSSDHLEGVTEMNPSTIEKENGKSDMLEKISKDILLSSNEESEKEDENSVNVSDTDKKKKKIKKTESDDNEDKEIRKEKGKRRKDPLLHGKITMSNSEEEEERDDEEIVASKKKKEKRSKKKKKNRLIDTDNSSNEENDTKKASDEESSFQEDNSSSSESDDENVKKKPVRKRIKRVKDSDESSDGKSKADKEKEENTRKKIRHVWSQKTLADTTKAAAKEEEERKKRIAERQKLYNDIYDKNLDEKTKIDKIVLDFNDETKEEILAVHPELVKKLKPHQAKGVQFMWTACFESIERSQKTGGSGCILAHCMGLGKTLQVITLIHTLLTNSEITNVRTVLVVCPLSTVLNWASEFRKWLDDIDSEQVNVFDLVKFKQYSERLRQVELWLKRGGVMIMGYNLFRSLINLKGRQYKKISKKFNEVLVEKGPDMVICDEGHLLKNEKTGISIAMNKLKTKRRIVLTGTPLQNNLKEYFCMVQFVKPNLLGTYKEYLNRFVNPITNGQYTDSTPHDIDIMRKRAHVLHKMLDAVVERRDYNVLAPFLPPKHEYVLFIVLTEVQINLYREYLNKFARNTQVKGTSYLFQDFQELQRICIHPRVLKDKSIQDRLTKDFEDDSEGSLKDFIDDDEEEESAVSSGNSSSEGSDHSSVKRKVVRRTRANPGDDGGESEDIEQIPHEEWWSKFCQNDELDNINHSSKIKLLFDILHQCELIGDKVLVFSQSLYSLNLIEYFLNKIDEATQSGDAEALAQVGGNPGSWSLGLDYFRLDGSTSCENRALWCDSFNNANNTRARLFLISTRAGGLGINLVAANRVIIFDVSWNPSYDIQSIYRVYRFGQNKPCYIYRFVTLGTMENKIYERQVTKQAISKRVIDEQQIDRHYNQNDLAELYAFNPISEEDRPIPLLPKDRLFADLLKSHEKEIFKYHEHNSLLENKEDEGLNEEERRAAWEEFENEKTAPKINLMQTMIRNGMYETLRMLVQQDNNGWTTAQVNQMLPTIVQRISDQVAKGDFSMYKRVEEKHQMRVVEQRRMQLIYQQYMQQLQAARGSNNQMSAAEMTKLAQMLNSFSQQMNSVPIQQFPSSSSTSFGQNMQAPSTFQNTAPRPHPNITEVVDLND